jgi:predicted GNAT family acetyltransferase
MHANVRENLRLRRFELPIANGVIAAAYYRLEEGRVVLVHTEVPFEFSGQGIASCLARGTFDLLRQSGRKAIPQCSFMSQFLAKHTEYADLVAG